MSTGSFACRSSKSRIPYPHSSTERRKQWLVTRGLLSPHNGPSRRLANLLPKSPRKQPPSPASSRPTTSQQHSSTHIRLELDQNSVPVVVATPSKLDNDDQHPSATRTISMPIDDSSRLRSLPSRSRPHHRRWITRDADRTASPPSRSKRFVMRLKRRSRDIPTSDTRLRASIDVPRARDRDADRVSLHRHSLDRRRDTNSTNTTSRPRGRAVYTVFDRELPRHILEGNARFETSDWNDYRDHIDELADDAKFMDYLTAPVQRRPPLAPESGATTTETQHLAVNKLYPLAFIRLLEAHAKYTSESCEPCNPEEEEHRYDDVDRDDEARVERTVSNGMYDMGRFRTVGGARGTADPGAGEEQANYKVTGLIDDKTNVTESSRYPSRFFSRISRESQAASVPVC